MFTKETINKVADIVRKLLNYNTPAYDPELAVKTLNGNIIYDITDECEDAFIEKSKDEQFEFVIHLNENKPFSRTRFTLAHELGHLFLHMGFKTPRWNEAETFKDSIYYRSFNRRDNNYSQEEIEANEFAAAFLMPKDQFKNELLKASFDLHIVANTFQVSLEAATNRARNIGIMG